ncbi:Uncharacterised protein [Vibrio cholerae]|nr:Uncharacterised protein [Vibrio cholerae]CSD55114.1 Uncharacterised protein [Vibrio cholerae]
MGLFSPSGSLPWASIWFARSTYHALTSSLGGSAFSLFAVGSLTATLLRTAKVL